MFFSAVTLSPLELISHHFHQLGNTSFSNLITRIGFWDSRILTSPLLEQLYHNFACCWHCSFFHGSWGPIPGCFSSSWVLGSRPWLFFVSTRPFGTCFIKPTTRSLCVSPSLLVNLPLTHWLTASPLALLLVAACDRVSVSCFKHTLLNTSLALIALGFASHFTRLCFSSCSAGCVASLHALLRRQLLMLVSYLSRRFLVSARRFSRARLLLLA